MKQLQTAAVASIHAAAALLVAGMNAGCASVPADFDVRQAAIVANAAPPTVRVNVSTSAGRGTGVGAMTGAGGAALAAPALCVAALFLYPVCVLAVIGSGAGIGAATGAAVGANLKESPEARQAKLALVTSEVEGVRYLPMLIDHLRGIEIERAIELPVLDAQLLQAQDNGDRYTGDSPWLVDVALLDIATEGKQRFRFSVTARLRVRRVGEAKPVFERTYSEDGDGELSLNEWAAHDAQPVSLDIDRTLRTIALQMADDLNRGAAAGSLARRTQGVRASDRVVR